MDQAFLRVKVATTRGPGPRGASWELEWLLRPGPPDQLGDPHLPRTGRVVRGGPEGQFPGVGLGRGVPAVLVRAAQRVDDLDLDRQGPSEGLARGPEDAHRDRVRPTALAAPRRRDLDPAD